MALSKDQSNEVNHRRDSFTHRICDDLCEDILQLLPFDDKLRLEFVSKQFQRCMFLKERHLVLDLTQSLTKLEKYLQKFPKITSIEPKVGHQMRTETIDLLFKYCPHLTEFSPFPDAMSGLYEIHG